MKTLVVGNTIIDTVLTLETLKADDKMDVLDKKLYVGGQAANVAQTLAMLGETTGFLSIIGEDGEAQLAKQTFAALNIDIDAMQQVRNAGTMSATIAVDQARQERSIFIYTDETLQHHTVNFDSSYMAQWDWIYTDGHQTALLAKALEHQPSHCKVLSDIERITPDTAWLIAQTDVLVAPAQVIQELAKSDDCSVAVETLLTQYQLDAVVATMGRDGSTGISKTHPLHFEPALKCHVVDTTGAGDAHHAGFLQAWANAQDLPQAMQLATRVAAAKCGSPGPVVKAATLAEFVAVQTGSLSSARPEQ